MHREILAKTSDCVPCTDIDADTVPADEFLDEAGWIKPNRSDTEIERKMCQASLDAGSRYRDSDDKELPTQSSQTPFPGRKNRSASN